MKTIRVEQRTGCCVGFDTFDINDDIGVTDCLIVSLGEEYMDTVYDMGEMFCYCGSSFRETNEEEFKKMVRSKFREWLEGKVQNVIKSGKPFNICNLTVLIWEDED